MCIAAALLRHVHQILGSTRDLAFGAIRLSATDRVECSGARMDSMTVVGYQLVRPDTRMQVTAVVADSGRTYRSHSRVGHLGRCDREYHIIDEHPVYRNLRRLRDRYTAQFADGYCETLIPLVVRTLPFDEEGTDAGKVIAAPAGRPAPRMDPIGGSPDGDDVGDPAPSAGAGGFGGGQESDDGDQLVAVGAVRLPRAEASSGSSPRNSAILTAEVMRLDSAQLTYWLTGTDAE